MRCPSMVPKFQFATGNVTVCANWQQILLQVLLFIVLFQAWIPALYSYLVFSAVLDLYSAFNHM